MTVRQRTLEQMRLLTSRERDVLQHLAAGQSNAEIGRSLFLAEQTIKFHLSNAYRKLRVSNRTEAVRAFAMLENFGVCPTCGSTGPAPHVVVNDVEYVPKAAT